MTSFQDDNDDFIVEDEEVFGHNETENINKAATGKSTSELPPRKKKRPARRSAVWAHFTENVNAEEAVCNCRYCGQKIGCDSKKVGTTPMKNHLERCKLFRSYKQSGSQSVLAPDSAGVVTAMKYDKELFRRSVNEMIILAELPFSFVESEGFRRFCFNVLPMYTVHCRKTTTSDIYSMYLQEKEKLKKLFSCDKKRVSLTTDIWTAPTTSWSYMVVTAHWIDADWVLQKRIISFKPITNHKAETISAQLSECLGDWGIKRVFTVTVDNAKANDKALRLLIDDLRLKSSQSLVRDGAHLHIRCCAHILNLIVRDDLASVNESVVAIRNAIKYVRSLILRLELFQNRVTTGNVSRGSVTLDCITRWNSTYLMLTSALKFRATFERLFAEDKLYNEYFKEIDDDGEERVGPPTSTDWNKIQRLVKFLRLFFNCTLAFSASKTVTSSLCYNEIVIIEQHLISLSSHPDEVLQAQATTMRVKFEKYWDGLLNMNPLLIIESVFDPRNKIQFASICFDKLYGKDSEESNHLRSAIKVTMKTLYEEYVSKLSTSSQPESKNDMADCEQLSELLFDLSDEDGYDRHALYQEMDNETATEVASSELDIYLLEKLVPRKKNVFGMDYDVLAWWKRNSVKYPILSELAKDVLAIQVSSVASESVFSTTGRILDPYRSCLSPHMIECLLCLQQWLKNTIDAEKVTNLAQMIDELEFHDSLVAVATSSLEQPQNDVLAE